MCLFIGHNLLYNHNITFTFSKLERGDEMSRIPVLTQFIGKAITDIKAYGIDQFDFTPNILDFDFSVGQFGYAVLEFGDSNLYISVDGLSTAIPTRSATKELHVSKRIRNCFVGAILESIEYDGKAFWIQFQGFEMLCGYYSPNEGHTDRSYFELDVLCGG